MIVVTFYYVHQLSKEAERITEATKQELRIQELWTEESVTAKEAVEEAEKTVEEEIAEAVAEVVKEVVPTESPVSVHVFEGPPAPITTTAVFGDVTEDAPPGCCPPVFEDYLDDAAGLYLCGVGNYIGMYVANEEDCLMDSTINIETEVNFFILNRIVGRIGDSNKDGNCDLTDVIDFVDCWSSLDNTLECICPFDWNEDDSIDLRDSAHLQLAMGSGITSYWNSVHGSN